ncbi:TPA: DUF1642 domain-containing protein [Streptococcus suis]
MNKQEAIEKIKHTDTLTVIDHIENQRVDMVMKNQVLDIISQIDEHQKVAVPKFIADWIEECKQSSWHLQKALYRLDDDWKVGDWAYDENDDLISEKVDVLARAWLDGYEIEKEKLYTVEIPNPVITDNSDSVTVLMKTDLGVVLTDVVNYIGREQESVYQLTESEIKQDFEWAWQWAKEVE